MLLCLAALLALAVCGGAFAEAAPENALEMTRRMGNGINLGNTMEACKTAKNAAKPWTRPCSMKPAGGSR